MNGPCSASGTAATIEDRRAADPELRGRRAKCPICRRTIMLTSNWRYRHHVLSPAPAIYTEAARKAATS